MNDQLVITTAQRADVYFNWNFPFIRLGNLASIKQHTRAVVGADGKHRVSRVAAEREHAREHCLLLRARLIR